MTGKPDIQRLIGDLLRPGLVASVDHAGRTCTVEIGDMETGPLPWITFRAGRVRIWSPPSIGEQCLVLCAEGDSNAGFVLPALYCDAFPPPSASDDVAMVMFDDGSVLSYDMAAHSLAITLASGSATIDAPQGVTINGPVTINDDVTVNGKLTATDDVVGGGKSLKGHKHGGVQGGSAQTGAPV